MEFEDFRKAHPLSGVVHEDLAMDWFHFENRLRRMTHDMIKPVVN